MAKVDLLVKNGAVWTPGGFVDTDVAVKEWLDKNEAVWKPWVEGLN